MDTIRIRKAVSGDTFKFKFRHMEKKKELTLTEAKKLANEKTTKCEPSKNLSSKDFDLATTKLIFGPPRRKTKLPKAEFKPTTAKAVTKIVVKPKNKLTKKVADAVIKLPKGYKVDKSKINTGSFDVHSRVGSQKVLEGEQLILVVLRKAAKPLTASEIGKRIFKNELNTKGIEFVVEVRGFKFYAYLNKHYTPMVNKKLVKVVGLTKGHRKMEKLWEPINV